MACGVAIRDQLLGRRDRARRPHARPAYAAGPAVSGGPAGTVRSVAIVSFEILSWDETFSGELADGWKVTRATVRKRYTGELEGTSVAEVTTTGQGTGMAYSALERVEGTLGGRTGSFLLQHGGAGDESGQDAFGHVVRGTGTGQLAGLTGTAVFAHDDAGARITLDWAI
jgi:hypothetical protein